MAEFLRAIPAAAQSPYALVAYAVAVILMIYGGFRLYQLRAVLKAVKSSPSVDGNQLKEIIEVATNTKLPVKISGEQWLRNNRWQGIVLIIIALIVAIAVITVVALSRSEAGTATKIKTPVLPKEGFLAVNAYAIPPSEAYPVGTRVGGIEWDTNYIGLKLDLTTKDKEVRNLDFAITLDRQISSVSIIGVGQISEFPGITAFLSSDTRLAIGIVTAGGETREVPLEPGNISRPEFGSVRPFGPVWRVHCEKLLPKTTARLVIAAIRFDSGTNRFTLIRRIEMRGSYQVEIGDVITNLAFNISHTKP